MCVDSPDIPEADPAIGEAAKQNAQLGKETLDFYKQQYADMAPQREQQMSLIQKVVDAQMSQAERNAQQADTAAARNDAQSTAQQALAQQYYKLAQEAQQKNQKYADLNAQNEQRRVDQAMGIADENQAIARDYWDYQENTFRPLEQGIVDDALAYDTSEKREAKAGDAMASTRSAFDQQRAGMADQAARYGIRPDSGNFMANMKNLGVNEAAATAAAGNKARNDVELQGYARKMDAANMGRGLASSQATSAGVALNAGNSTGNAFQTAAGMNSAAASPLAQAANISNSAISANNSIMSPYGPSAGLYGSALSAAQGGLSSGMDTANWMGQGYGAAINGNNSMMNGLNNVYGNQVQSYDAQVQAQDGLYGALGSAAGLASRFFI